MLMSSDSDYKLVISDTVSSYENENVFLPHSYEYSFRTSNDGGFGIFGDKITVDEGEGTAVFSANIIKSDENSYKGTIIICGYSDEEVDGKVYSKLEKQTFKNMISKQTVLRHMKQSLLILRA